MRLLLLAMAALLIGGVAALATAGKAGRASRLGSGGAIAGCLLGIVPALFSLAGAPAESIRLAWDVPYGAFFLTIDPLSAFFLLPIFVVSGLAAVYGTEYLAARGDATAVGVSWFFFNLLVASMALVVVARNAVLFLVAWEVMALASFFLVTVDDEQESVRAAGWTYLVATHLGTAFLLALFVLLGRGTGSLDFDRFTVLPTQASALFLVAVIGFGAKAGFVPMHVWLPEAHPAAPSHVSAVMSGVMIKMGIYGLLRMLTLLGPPPLWWGWLLCGIGLMSGVFGILFALAQHDLKRLLAYSSVENIGIIALGLGVGLLGSAAGVPLLAVLGFTGALLHVWNHALFKSLLFLGAGAVAHATGTRDIDRLGGLLRRMPVSGAAFLVGAVGVAGLPPLNGFASEFLIYLGAFRGAVAPSGAAAVPALAVIVALALIGGLAAACFAQAFGIVFLGEARSQAATHAHDAGPAMRAPMLLLAAACVLLGVLAPLLTLALRPVVSQVSGLSPEIVGANLAPVAPALWGATAAALALCLAVAALWIGRRRLLARRTVAEAGTWDCGYARPVQRAQYTGSSLAQPLTSLFAPALQTRRRLRPPQGLFPSQAALVTETPDVCATRLYTPAFAGLGRALAALRWLQHGEVHLYVLYIALTLLLLLVWKLGWP